MRSAISTAAGSPAHLSQARNLGPRVLRDLAGVVLLAIAALAAGLLMNRFSSAPLPIVYQTPEQRFDAELTTLVAAPPFKIAPAASVGLDEFRSTVEGKSALILDARPSPFFERGHVPGALNLARDDFAQDYRNLAGVLQAAQDKPIIVYCSGGECHDSRLVANALLSLGFSNVRVFTGGWDEWSAAGLPASTGSER
ncbi:MAG: rhodanese-like domain-containing protein [Candidatus Binatus sp.]|uniref:rhodanese-like domain-containing protein n=3 Tax=Candidatus Binatus sp. TaxID=2811406 RepID=UPI003BB06E15